MQNYNTNFDEEVQFLTIKCAFNFLNFCGHGKGKQQLVNFKQS